MAQARGEAGMECPASPPAECPDCHAMFANHQAMIHHMGREFKRSNWNTHIHCVECTKYLPTHDALNAHLKRNHAKDQKLDCPACDRTFLRADALVRHIEQKECPCIDPAKLDAVREQKLWFARELQSRHFGNYDEEVEAAYMSRNSALRPKAEATVRPHPVQFEAFETDQVDVYWYHQNVIEPSRIARSNKTAQSEQPSNPVPTVDASRQNPQLSSHETSAPFNVKKEQQSILKAGATLLDDFDPDQNGRLQPSLIDYYDPGTEGGSGRHGPWSAFFNPWENDDLVGLSTCSSSRASSRAPTPVSSRASTPRAQSSAATVVPKSPTRTIVTIDDDSSTLAHQAAPHAKKAAPAMPSKTSRALTPSRFSGGRAVYTYSPYNARTLMPLRNHNTLKSSEPSDSGVQSAGQSSAVIAPRPSQALAPLKQSQAFEPIKSSTPTASSAEKPLLPEPAVVSQALTPTKAPGAVVPALRNSGMPMDDYDEVKQAIANHIARHNPRNPNFRVQNYWVPLIEKYKCPMPQCFKSFKKAGQFESHISTHMVEKKVRYPCPGCHDMFDTIASLIAHTESQSIKCRFRHSKNYGHFLSQALAGIVDVVGEDLEHGTVQFAISKDAKKTFGALTPGTGNARRSRSDEFKAATAALEERVINEEDEENRRFWEKHEREVEAQMAKKREEERAMKMKEQEAREAEQTRLRNAERERNRKAKLEHMKKAREAEQESARRAKLAQERMIQQRKVREAEQHRMQNAKAPNQRAIKQEPEERKGIGHQWAQVKEEPSDMSEDMKKLEIEERQLLESMEKIKEQRWKLQQEQEKSAKEAAQKEMQPQKPKLNFDPDWW